MVDGKDDEAVAALLKSIELAPSVQAYQGKEGARGAGDFMI